MTPFRVLRVITRMNVGGPAIHVALLATRLDPARFRTLLASGREGPREGNMLALGRLGVRIRPRIVPALGRRISPLDDLRALVELVAITRHYRPHIVHTHLAKAGFIGRIAARLTGTRVVVHTFHGSVFREYFGARESALFLAVERALGRLSTRLIAITPGQRDELISFGIAPPERVVCIPLGLDLAPFLEPLDPLVARRALGVGSRGPVVGLVARLVAIKDVATFLRGVAILARSWPDLTALVVGDGEERPALEAIARELGLLGRCRFIGWRAQMPPVYASMDVLALTSLNEGSPVSVIEGMAAGRPVVATAVGGVPDVVQENETGRLVPPRDAAALAGALDSLLRDEGARARMGARAREVATSRYGADRLVADIERLYLGLLSS